MIERMQTVILSGGYGTRLQEATKGLIPKPMVDIGGRPLIAHIVQLYADQGYRDFVIAAGFRWEVIRDWFYSRSGNLGVQVVNTGEHTQTGGRLIRLSAGGVLNPRPFFLTYGDGLSDLNLLALYDFHCRQRQANPDYLVTLTAVQPPNRFGVLTLDRGLVSAFDEKPENGGWINGGFYVVEPEVRDLISGDGCVWESDVLPALAWQGRLGAYRHTGFWQMIDTPRDLNYVEGLWESGRAEWTRLSGERDE